MRADAVSVAYLDNCRDRLRHFSTRHFTTIFSSLSESVTYKERGCEFGLAVALPFSEARDLYPMFKISMVETKNQRRLILEGKLVAPWTADVESAWRSAGEQLRGRTLVIDLTNVTLIGVDGENILFRLMKEGAKFSCRGVFTKHVLRKLARICGCKP
jgi:hypothetical protein